MTWVGWLVFQSPDTQAWQNDYLQGTGCEMYTETLSPSFTGMTFPQASDTNIFSLDIDSHYTYQFFAMK
ncbi:Similar to slo: Calcium-activated potassium channel slowpoke (Drosophila melanogaster) [Cotesia congregata]|uniref:Similar to slo: Calcium-activated potassium channel slowpoke (Drosophila melanogaster) n=1 Tax=Cotesia congregata TaxID=51543 RepID=A0A8J2MJQ0_COTCN|nr:Similar to slo: Calcium-activated potassium channel slowpoke (Drosophila melanogaster) [Cotesia congregata]